MVIFTSHEDVSKHPLMKKLGGVLKTVACARPDARGMEAWIKSAAAGLNQPISPQAVKVLANSGLDMYYLEHLLQKIKFAKHPGCYQRAGRIGGACSAAGYQRFQAH